MINNCNINNLAKSQVSALFHSRAIRRSALPKFTELYLEKPCWCPSGWAPTRKLTETSHSVTEFWYKSVNFISRGFQKQYSTTFSNARTVQIAKFPEISLGISHFFNQLGRHGNTASRKSSEIQA